MSSAAAQRLAASVPADEPHHQSTEWHSMDTTTAESTKGASSSTPSATPTSGTSEAMEGASLVQNSSSRSKKSKRASLQSAQDIYEQAELMEQAADYQDNDDVMDEDEALLYRRASPVQRVLLTTQRTLGRLYTRLYGDQLPLSEMLRTLTLAMTLFFMIGGYWLLRSLKDPILTALCGVAVIPKAKMLSVGVVLLVVSIYNRLLDSNLPKHKLFYVFGMFYFALFGIISLLLQDPTLGLPNQRQSPTRILGWISYCGIESFGSVMVSLFWSFANSNISLETAKASYGVMVATAQVGSILGPTLVNRYAHIWGVPRCYQLGALCMLLLQGCMYIYVRVYGTRDAPLSTDEAATMGPPPKKKKTNITEGLVLFWQHHYVKGIFAISCLFMVEVTIVDFTMKVLARDYFASLHPCLSQMSCWDSSTEHQHGMSQDATAAFTTFMGLFGQATNTLSFLLSLLGTSAVIRYLGLRLSLLLFPTLCLAVIVTVRLRPTLYVVFAAMMALKACSYALNNPTKEILYQPTSPAVKYKAKSWIDIFGARGSKALGSVITNAFSDSTSQLVANGSLVGMAVASFLIWNARYMGQKFEEYTANGVIVGEDMEGEGAADPNVQMAMVQNDDKDTSCAIFQDEEVGPEEEGQEMDEEDEEEEEDEASARPEAQITTL